MHHRINLVVPVFLVIPVGVGQRKLDHRVPLTEEIGEVRLGLRSLGKPMSKKALDPIVRGCPDFKTIADFRRDNRGAFRSVFREFVLLCRRLDLYGRELLAVDGTRIKAVNNKDRNFTCNSLEKFIHAANERLDDYLRRLDEGDVEEGGTGGGARTKNLAEKIEALRAKRGRYGALLAELERTGESQISLTDPDSRAMAAHTKVGVGYNIQVAVDAKNNMIVEQAVTNQVVDMGLLTQTAEPARAILDVDKIDVVADRGYFKIEDIEACEKAGLIPYVPKPQRGSSVRNGFFRKDEFRYDTDRDVYVCPAGETLSPNHEGKLRDLKKIRRSITAIRQRAPFVLSGRAALPTGAGSRV
jgi:Transposase DDE domain